MYCLYKASELLSITLTCNSTSSPRYHIFLHTICHRSSLWCTSRPKTRLYGGQNELESSWLARVQRNYLAKKTDCFWTLHAFIIYLLIHTLFLENNMTHLSKNYHFEEHKLMLCTYISNNKTPQVKVFFSLFCFLLGSGWFLLGSGWFSFLSILSPLSLCYGGSFH
jgi:hypothetical protein